jgi:hypothetical protein
MPAARKQCRLGILWSIPVPEFFRKQQGKSQNLILCEISGSQGGEYENYSIQGYSAV